MSCCQVSRHLANKQSERNKRLKKEAEDLKTELTVKEKTHQKEVAELNATIQKLKGDNAVLGGKAFNLKLQFDRSEEVNKLLLKAAKQDQETINRLDTKKDDREKAFNFELTSLKMTNKQRLAEVESKQMALEQREGLFPNY